MSGPPRKTVVLPVASSNTSVEGQEAPQIVTGNDDSDLNTFAFPNNVIGIEIEGHHLAWFDDLPD